jgi:anti-sigma factor ChrR (cupin superfamily)
MSKSMRKQILSVLALSAVAGISYAAGAAKAKQAVLTPAADIVWEDLMPGAPLKMAKLWGDRSKGAYGMLLKLPAGFEAGNHSHSLDYHAVVVQGSWQHTVAGDAAPPKEMGPGSYALQPGKQDHNDICKSKTDCIILIQQDGKGDFIPAKAPKGEKAEKPAEKK